MRQWNQEGALLFALLGICTGSGRVTRCCLEGTRVNPSSMECSMEEEGKLGDVLVVVDPETNQTTTNFSVVTTIFNKLCEAGQPTPTRVDTVTSDSFIVHPDGSEARYDCLELNNTSGVVAWTCPEAARCHSEACVEKCCREHEVLVVQDQFSVACTAEVTNKTLLWNPRQLEEVESVTDLQTRHSPLDCHGFYSLDRSEYSILVDGSMNHSGITTTRQYCMDHLYHKDSQSVTPMTFRCPAGIGKVPTKPKPPPPFDGDQSTLTVVLYTAVGLLSLVCLIIIFLVYWFVPSFNNLHGRIVLVNIVCAFLVNLFVMFLYTTKLPPLACTILGYLGYFSAISMFAWMTVLSFDLSWTFTRTEAPQQSSDSNKFCYYSIFGLGLPAMLTSLLASLQLALSQASEFNPNIGLRKCWILGNSGNKPTLLPIFYFHVPVALLMITNAVLFVRIIVSLVIAKRKTRVARMSSQR